MGTVAIMASVGVFTALAAAIDLRMHRIPNYVTVPAALLGLAYHTLAPNGWGPLVSLGGFGVGFALLLLPWLLGGGGMGDVKLLAALGAWLGPMLILVAFAASVIFAAAIALAIMLYSVVTRGVSKTGQKYLGSWQMAGKLQKKGVARTLPFAVPVAMSTWAVLAWMATYGGL